MAQRLRLGNGRLDAHRQIHGTGSFRSGSLAAALRFCACSSPLSRPSATLSPALGGGEGRERSRSWRAFLAHTRHKPRCGHRPYANARTATPRRAMGSFPSPQPSPLGEGEPSLRGEQSTALGLPPARCALFPLPEGEGQGAGKRRGLPSRVSDRSRSCRTGVLRQSRRFPYITVRSYGETAR